MVSMKCKNCGGEMSVDLKGELMCPYCGTKAHFSDIEFAEYKRFRRNLLEYLRAAADSAADREEEHALWTQHESVSYRSEDGTDIDINYLFYSCEDGVQTYVAKNSVIYVFPREHNGKVYAMLHGIELLQYPSADIKKLSRYFPSVKSRIRLDDGRMLLAVAKPENAYPLFAFGSMRPEHAAWVVSRLENICCVFEYSGMSHCGISIDSVFINTRTHEAFLYGGWWNAGKKTGASDHRDLAALRKVAGQILGEYRGEAPKEMLSFIAGRPAEDAYSDFALWDQVIEKGFGGHKFAEFKK